MRVLRMMRSASSRVATGSDRFIATANRSLSASVRLYSMMRKPLSAMLAMSPSGSLVATVITMIAGG